MNDLLACKLYKQKESKERSKKKGRRKRNGLVCGQCPNACKLGAN
jgi:hypothetical protein